MSTSAACARRSRRIPTIRCSSTRCGGLGMSIERVGAPRSAPAEKVPMRAAISHRPMGEDEIDALRPLLLQFVQHVAVSFAECRCSVQLFERTDALRTVVVSDMPLGMLGQASFPLGVGVAGWVGQTGAPLLVHD